MHAVRVWFKKVGRAKFISHLDVNRLMTRAVRRAALPIWYTEGFNPHPYLCFPLPLSLGQESDGEVMELRITDDQMANETVMERLNAVLPAELSVTKAEMPFCDAREIARAVYAITAELPDAETALTAAEAIRALAASGAIMAEKTGKKGRQKVTREINLCDDLQDLNIWTQDAFLQVTLTLPAGDRKNINPSLLTQAFLKLPPLQDALFSIRRTALLTEDGSLFS